MFVLLALIVDMIPTPSNAKDSPLVMRIYECSVGLFIIQYLVVLFTHQMATWKDEMTSGMQRVAGQGTLDRHQEFSGAPVTIEIDGPLIPVIGLKLDYSKCPFADQKPEIAKISEQQIMYDAVFELKIIKFLLCKQSKNFHEIRSG